MGVGEAIIDGGQAGGGAVGQPAELDGSGFAGEGEEGVTVHVHGEIDEDVDLVVADEIGELCVGETQHIAPGVNVGAEPLGDWIGSGHF
jgi:hypothetical protein